MDKVLLTNETLRELMSERGGWNRETLEFLGVKWPPKRKWKKHLIGRWVDRDRYYALGAKNRISVNNVKKRAPKKAPPKLRRHKIGGMDLETGVLEGDWWSCVVQGKRGRETRQNYFWGENEQEVLDYQK